jgi:hypothetical protein
MHRDPISKNKTLGQGHLITLSCGVKGVIDEKLLFCHVLKEAE